MQTFHGDPELKLKLVDWALEHLRADTIIQGYGYWQDDPDGVPRGCAVGCLAHEVGEVPDGPVVRSVGQQRDAIIARAMLRTVTTTSACSTRRIMATDGHECFRRLREDFGLPEWLASRAEEIFEHSLHGDEARAWPARFADAIPVGVELAESDRCPTGWPPRPRFRAGAADELVAWLSSLEPSAEPAPATEPDLCPTVSS